MERGDPAISDWRDAAAYAPLAAADRAILAWEWLRRVPAYRTAARTALSAGAIAGANHWGLHRYEDPDRPAPSARPLWTAGAFDAVLTADARSTGDPRAFDLDSLSSLLSAGDDEGQERILLTDGWRLIRLDLIRGSARAGAIKLRFSLPGPPLLSPPLLALRRFDSLVRTGRFAAALHGAEPRAYRQLLLLRTADALAGGAGQREIAAGLLDPDAGRPGWRDERPHLRLQAQRLVRDARAYLDGGYRALLWQP